MDKKTIKISAQLQNDFQKGIINKNSLENK
jgi:hypothetical protein